MKFRSLDLIHKFEALPTEEQKWAFQWFVGSLESPTIFTDCTKEDRVKANWSLDKLADALKRVEYCICKTPNFNPPYSVHALCLKCDKFRYK